MLMDAVLSDSKWVILMEKLRFNANEFNIVNRNMPFMNVKIEERRPKINDFRGGNTIVRLDTY